MSTVAAYKVVVTSSAKRAAKKLPVSIRREAIKRSLELSANPYTGEKLTSSLRFLFSLHFKYKNVQYRIAYTVNIKQKLIIVHLIGPRENFYNKLKKLFK
jgi:mRNA-degrading endonuclease RelE of RelBE toxin-antitoxin system